jgi:hypothetical protein
MNNILLHHLIVISKGLKVYDEYFHKGLNIIRGQNGSGKSTIVELIYYVLGADHLNWKEESLKCDYVLAEFEISNQILTLRREINKDKQQPISIFWGKIEDSSATTWQVYSLKRSSERNSFSQIVLRALDIPDNDDNFNITMHQLLRVFYIDQMSLVNALLRPENFDSYIIREAIVKTLMGAYNINIFQMENDLKIKKTEYDNYKTEINKLKYILNENGTNLSIDELKSKICENIERIKKIDENTSSQNKQEMNKNARTQPDVLDKIFQDISNTKKELVSLIQKQNSLNYDIFDSENFIEELRQKNIDLANSIAMRTYLPSLELTYCPMCLNPIAPIEDKNICPICKKTFSQNNLNSNTLRLKNELAFQIKESESLLAKKKIEENKLKSNIAMQKKNIVFLQTQIDSYTITVQTTEQQERDASLFLKGNLSKEIEYLNRELSFQEKVNDDIRILENLKENISILKNAIEDERKKIQRNYANAMSAIKEISTEFIKADLPRDLPSDDLSLSKLNIDFEKTNSFSIEEKNNFAASSMVYLKNSIMFAFFFASIKLKEMSYPRFIMCDNIEDKGMEMDRSHKFQLNLYNKSNEYKNIDHQIIITTSMLEPSLDKPEICVGKAYTQTSKSLNFGDTK